MSIRKFLLDLTSEYYVEFGDKRGNSTPAFSLLFLLKDALGHVQIEVDMEIDDNSKRSRDAFFI